MNIDVEIEKYQREIQMTKERLGMLEQARNEIITFLTEKIGVLKFLQEQKKLQEEQNKPEEKHE